MSIFSLSGHLRAGQRGAMVAIPRPAHRLGRDRRVESPSTELELGVVDLVAALDQPERQPPGPRSLRIEIGSSKCGLVCLVMALLEHERQPLDLAAIQRCQSAPHLDGAGSGRSGAAEPTGPGYRPGHGAVAAASVTQAQQGGHVGERQVDSAWMLRPMPWPRACAECPGQGGSAAVLLAPGPKIRVHPVYPLPNSCK